MPRADRSVSPCGATAAARDEGRSLISRQIVMPTVSVVLPVHNGAAHIENAVRSILRQTLSDFELLVVDDASTDATREIVTALRDPRIRLIASSQRLRLAGALNLGIDEARSDLVARMDGDDIAMPDRLAVQVRHMNRHPNVGLSGTWVRTTGAGKEIIFRFPCDPAHVRALALFDNPFAHPSVILRKPFFQKHGLRYDVGYYPAEDYELWTRALNLFAGDNIARPLLMYRIHGASLTRANHAEMDRQGSRIAERMLSPFGFTLSPTDILAHQYLGTHRLHPDRTENALANAERWLIRLVERNRTGRLYSPAVFESVAAEILFRACYHCLHLGWGVVRMYLRSEVTRRCPQKRAVLLLAAIKRRLRRQRPVARIAQ